jgi:hypothetical protein
LFHFITILKIINKFENLKMNKEITVYYVQFINFSNFFLYPK